MSLKLTPVVAAITLMLSGSLSYADGGAAGNNGSNSVIRNQSVGLVGVDNGQADGKDGAFTSGLTITTGPSGIPGAGEDGKSPTNNTGGGGAGGHGGGSVIGATSTGGAGAFHPSFSANGGNGGNVTGNDITLTNVTLNGADGGAGGSLSAFSNSSNSYNSGGAGTAGHGGGSVFGGLSTGGAAGKSYSDTSPSSSSANGGNGGEVSSHAINISDSTLTGAAGGAGGRLSASSAFVPSSIYYSVESSSIGGAGTAGHGGGSVFGGLSTGGTAGETGGTYRSTTSSSSASGGNGGSVTGNEITLTNVTLNGAAGGAGGSLSAVANSPANVSTSLSAGGAGAAGHGGGSVFGGLSTGGAAGESYTVTTSSSSSANGGNGGEVSSHTINISDSTLTGAAGGAGGSLSASSSSSSASSISTSIGGAGAAGHGGGSVFGGLSTGGAGGKSHSTTTASQFSVSSNGGNGGSVTGNEITLTNVTLNGADGGAGGSLSSSSSSSSSNAYAYVQNSGGAGAAGHGGGSVFGGLSTGGAGGESTTTYSSTFSSANGGNGGDVLNNQITLTNVTLNGAAGGAGGSLSISSSSSSLSNSTTSTSASSNYGGAGAAGHGGGSVFGGLSTGGAGGNSTTTSSTSTIFSSTNGGNGGDVLNNQITLTNVTLNGAAGGEGGSLSASFSYLSSDVASSFSRGGVGAAGHGGGSVFGGLSTGGAGGGVYAARADQSANGGNGGDVLNNQITISGVSKISGDIYGGISQGGDRGKIKVGSNPVLDGEYGQGGLVQNNTITLIGSDIQIGGSIFGGLSLNGDGSANDHKAFSGNTLNLVGYQGSVQGIANIENYNWTLPEGVFNGSTIIEILGPNNVNVDNTKHTIGMYNDGKRLYEGDAVVMISKADGTAAPRDHRITQGHFLQYDGVLETIKSVDGNGDATSQLVLTIEGKEDSTPVDPADPPVGPIEPKTPAGVLQETSEKFLVSRLSTMATLNRGADVLADLPEEMCRKKLFGVVHGGSHRSNTGEESHIKVNDVSLTLGGATCFELQSKSTVMLGGFVQHGRSNYDSYNYFDDRGDVYGWGKVQYTGVGLLFEMNVAETGPKGSAPAIGSKDGLYLKAALSAGQAKTSFWSNLRDTQGVQGKYDSTSPYVTAMVGAGYAWKIDEKRLLDFYGRYTFGHLSSDTVMIGKDQLSLETMKSSRLRLGARYHYAVKEDVKPYVGVAFEHEFMGHAYGSAYNMSIHSPSLKGSSGVVEVGVSMKPSKTNKAWTVNMGVQGTLGDRRGFSGGVALKYEF